MKLIKIIFVFIWGLAVTIDPAVGDDRTPRIGVITFLSGPNATIGTAIRNGIELARHQRPELLQMIDFQYEDDQGDAKLDISAYRKLTNGRAIDILGSSTELVGNFWLNASQTSVIVGIFTYSIDESSLLQSFYEKRTKNRGASRSVST